MKIWESDLQVWLVARFLSLSLCDCDLADLGGEVQDFSCPFFFLFLFLFCFLRPNLQHMGWNQSYSCWPQPQPQQCEIWAVSATYAIAHSNTGSPTHWVRPGIEAASSWILVKFVNCWAMKGPPGLLFLRSTPMVLLVPGPLGEQHFAQYFSLAPTPDACQQCSF